MNKIIFLDRALHAGTRRDRMSIYTPCICDAFRRNRTEPSRDPDTSPAELDEASRCRPRGSHALRSVDRRPKHRPAWPKRDASKRRGRAAVDNAVRLGGEVQKCTVFPRSRFARPFFPTKVAHLHCHSRLSLLLRLRSVLLRSHSPLSALLTLSHALPALVAVGVARRVVRAQGVRRRLLREEKRQRDNRGSCSPPEQSPRAGRSKRAFSRAKRRWHGERYPRGVAKPARARRHHAR